MAGASDCGGEERGRVDVERLKHAQRLAQLDATVARLQFADEPAAHVSSHRKLRV
jgi:hypothetical protein